ncbi:hypothetical protein [Haloplanus halophilus]|uniref:hypothetical protein n=1 Tax=Haloplanus halophilus TaxID=2949993 RepID=UPI0020400941|nr:hypothetical protein [Haloplanus sp. GDY1]
MITEPSGAGAPTRLSAVRRGDAQWRVARGLCGGVALAVDAEVERTDHGPRVTPLRAREGG